MEEKQIDQQLLNLIMGNFEQLFYVYILTMEQMTLLLDNELIQKIKEAKTDCNMKTSTDK